MNLVGVKADELVVCERLSSSSFFRSAAFRRARCTGQLVPSTAAAAAIIPRPGGTVSPNAASASRENDRERLRSVRLFGSLVYSTSAGRTGRPVALSISRPVTITPGGTSIVVSIGLSPSVSSMIVPVGGGTGRFPCLGLTLDLVELALGHPIEAEAARGVGPGGDGGMRPRVGGPDDGALRPACRTPSGGRRR